MSINSTAIISINYTTQCYVCAKLASVTSQTNEHLKLRAFLWLQTTLIVSLIVTPSEKRRRVPRLSACCHSLVFHTQSELEPWDVLRSGRYTTGRIYTDEVP